MTRHLLLFSDGTGNSSGKLFKTNVWRLYQALDLADPQHPPMPRQFAFYDDGVGTESFKPMAVLGGALGVGLSRNVVDLYVFLCRMYQPGDKIFAFGFSRGAFTIRVLIGLVMAQGLLRYEGSEADLRRLAMDAYRAYRAKRFTSMNPLVGLLRTGRDMALTLINTLLGRVTYAQATRVGAPGMDGEICVEFVGLWDTVDAYGLPVDELTRAIDKFVWPLTMRDYTLNKRVLNARHALALDDERNAFHPRLWNEDPEETTPGRIRQVWFAGVHSNVGGGYPDDGLSHVPLNWIISEAQRFGVRFEASELATLKALADENGPIYDSRRGLAGYYRYNPRRIERLGPSQGIVIPKVLVHRSVLRRIAAGNDGYAPISIPGGFDVIEIDGTETPGQPYQALAAAPNENAVRYDEAREAVFNTVWARRVIYFLTLGLTLVLALLPLFKPGNGACAGSLCVFAKLFAAVGWLLPSFATVWTNSYASNPDIAFPLLVLVWAAIRWGDKLETRVRDRMRRVWYAVPGLQPASTREIAPPATVGSGFAALLRRVRSSTVYLGAFRVLTHALLPFAFLLTLGYLFVAGVTRLDFALRSSSGSVCVRADPMPPSASAASVWFDPRSVCQTLGIATRKGATYRITQTVTAQGRFLDATIPAGPNGFECGLEAGRAITLAAAIPLRRHPSQPWFQPMVRVGPTGNDTYVLAGTPQTAPMTDRCTQALVPHPLPSLGCDEAARTGPPVEVFKSEFVARSEGELFVYVNDAIGLPTMNDFFYRNNRGCSKVTVEEVRP